MKQNAEPRVNLWADPGTETQVQTMAEPEKNNSPGHPHPLSYEIKVQILPIWGEENMDAVV